MTTAVSILNWNGLNHLKTYLPYVVEHSTLPDVQILLIDNGSTDSSCSWVKENYPGIKIINLDKNYGFAGGYNRGLEEVNADRFVLLNSDVRVTSGWLDAVTKTMLENNFTACSPRVLNDFSPTEFEYAGASGGFIDRDGFMFCRGRIFDSYESAELYKDDLEVFWASGAALFVDSDAWNEVGGLDEDFFAHMEEIDLCWRLKNRGLKVGVCGSSNVYHLGGGTLDKSSPEKVFLNFRNNLVLLLKNKEGVSVLFTLRRMVLDGVAALRFLIRGEFKYFFSVFRSHLSFYTMILSTLRKRKIEKEARKNCPPNLIGFFNSSIIVAYFIKGIRKFSDIER